MEWTILQVATLSAFLGFAFGSCVPVAVFHHKYRQIDLARLTINAQMQRHDREINDLTRRFRVQVEEVSSLRESNQRMFSECSTTKAEVRLLRKQIESLQVMLSHIAEGRSEYSTTIDLRKPVGT